MFEAILSLVKRHDTVILHRHSNPDGDAIGSQVGLKHILRAAFPEKTVLAVGDAPGRYGFVTDSTPDEVADAQYENALAIVLDCSAEALISDARWKTAAATARIDHHLFLTQLAQEEAVDTSFESCCGLIVAFAQECGLAIPPVSAAALYTGMVTDSGRFRYDSTSPRTLRLAAALLEVGVDTNAIYRELYADTLASAQLRASFTMRIQKADDDVAYLYTTRDELAALGMDTFSASRGMVGTMADLRGVDVWANFTETEGGVLCELRSSKYNINPIAVRHGGGGHAKASGATLKDRGEAMQLLQELCALKGENHG